MRILISFLFMLSSVLAYGQNEEFMHKNIKQLQMATSSTDFKTIIESFDNNAKKNSKNWIAKYYAAFSRLQYANSPGFKEIAGTNEYLTEAKEIAEDGLKLSKDEELYILKLYIEFQLAGKAGEAEFEKQSDYFQKQLSVIRGLNGSNPRLFVLEGIYYYSLPESIGDKNMARNLFTQAISMFDQGETMRNSMLLSWGNNIAIDYLKRLGDN